MLPQPFLPWWPAVPAVTHAAPRASAAPSAAPLAAETITLVVVIPAHGQPGLLPEAIEAVLAQQEAPPTAVVVVDDGCPDPGTTHLASAYAAAHPGRVYAVRQRNAGLSAARNTGIEVVLAAFPACQAVYFLDADNRLHPHFLARAWAALEAAPAGTGWVYPDFDMFGLPLNGSAGGRYSRLAHLVDNLCEAGSLVRRDLLAAGLRFDETLKSGFEDWDFWLQAMTRGFRGQHLPQSGFRYRRRQESMLTQAERQRDLLLDGLRRKHAALYRPRRLLRLEAEEAPRFAWFASDEPTVRLLLDPTAAPVEALTPAAARQRLLAAQETPTAVHFPPVSLFAEAAVLELLARHRLLHGLFWRAEVELRQSHFMGVELHPGAAGELRQEMLTGAGGLAACQIVFARSRLLHESAGDASAAWLESLRREAPRPRLAKLRLALPDGKAPPLLGTAPPVRLLEREVSAMAQAAEAAPALPREWRSDHRTRRDELAWQCQQQQHGIGSTLPLLPVAGHRDIGLLLPVFAFGGVEKVVLAYAVQLRAAGWRPHLFVIGATTMALGAEARTTFESITLLSGMGEDQEDWSAGYFGGTTPLFGARPQAPDALGLLSGMQAVLNTHSVAGHALMARLRKLGVRTYVGLHVMERSPWQHPFGNPHTALAYEHAYDGFVVISRQLRDWCLGQGVPGHKLHLVPNAPGYATNAARVAALVAARQTRAPGPLRVLYLGRLDRQKGLDRLAAMVSAHPGLHWRIVGAAVLADAGLTEFGIPVEPPVTQPDQLDAVLGWADVLVLPSLFEGVPLVVLEAQRLGCAVIATDVGAVAEIIRHGEDGLLVPHNQPEAAIIAQFGTLLHRLDQDHDLLRILGERAAARVAAQDWPATLRDFLAHLAAACPLEAK